MDSFYVKKENIYCYFSNKHQTTTTLIPMVQYLIDKNLLTDKQTIDVFKSFKSHLHFSRGDFSGGVIYGVPILNYYERYEKEMSNIYGNREFSLDELKEAFLFAKKMAEYENILLKALQPLESLINLLTFLDFKDYFNYERYKNTFFNSLLHTKKKKLLADMDNKEVEDEEEEEKIQNYLKKELQQYQQEIIPLYPKQLVTESLYQCWDLFVPHFNAKYDRLLEVFSEDGVPYSIESNTVMEHLVGNTYYAIFLTSRFDNQDNEPQFYKMQRCGNCSLVEADFFTTVEKAKQTMKEADINGVIVSVKIEPQEVLSTHANVHEDGLNLFRTHLEQKKLAQKKSKLELTQELLEHCSHEDEKLKEMLKELIKKEEQKNNRALKKL